MCSNDTKRESLVHKGDQTTDTRVKFQQLMFLQTTDGTHPNWSVNVYFWIFMSGGGRDAQMKILLLKACSMRVLISVSL